MMERSEIDMIDAHTFEQVPLPLPGSCKHAHILRLASNFCPALPPALPPPPLFDGTHLFLHHGNRIQRQSLKGVILFSHPGEQATL